MVRLATAAIPVSVALACPARADDALRYRQIRFGNALTEGRISACSMQFQITFHDPSAPPRRDDSVVGELTFSRRDGRLSADLTMRAFGDSTTKFTGIGQIADVTLSAGGEVLRLEPRDAGADPTREALSPDQVPDLLMILDGQSTLSFTLSKPVRRFAFPFSLSDLSPVPDSADLARAGRSIFDDCMTALTKAPG